MAHRFIQQADGRYRSQSLMPDHEYEITAWDRGGAVVPRELHRINLPEGGSAELTLVLRKRPKPPEVGKPAPAFAVKTLDGRELSLAGLRGKVGPAPLRLPGPRPPGTSDPQDDPRSVRPG